MIIGRHLHSHDHQHMHHTGLQDEPHLVEEEDLEVPAPEAPEAPGAKEPSEELPKCVDHQPSSFERGKVLEHPKSPTS
jgi:hypothetical protein